VLIHYGPAARGGPAADVEIQAAHLVATLERMRSIVSRHTGQPMERIATDMGRDRWFDAPAALEYGFVDRIVTSVDQICPPHRRQPIGLGADRRVDGEEVAS
jgi:ATP-dependent Clp protease protease subunit